MAVAYPLINGARHSWASVEAKFNGKIYVGFDKLDYSDSLKSTKVRGAHPEPIGRTRGQYDAEGSFTMFLEEFNALLLDLGPGYKEVPFDITSSYSEDGLTTIIDEVIGCRIEEVKSANAEGADPSKRECTLSVMKVRWNGVESLKAPLGAG